MDRRPHFARYSLQFETEPTNTHCLCSASTEFGSALLAFQQGGALRLYVWAIAFSTYFRAVSFQFCSQLGSLMTV